MSSNKLFSPVLLLAGVIAFASLCSLSASAAVKKKLFTGHTIVVKFSIEQEVVRQRLRIVAEIKRRAALIGEDSRNAEVRLLESARDILTILYDNANDTVSNELEVESEKGAKALRAAAHSHLLTQYLYQLRAGFNKVDAETPNDMSQRVDGYDAQIQEAADFTTLMPSIETLKARVIAYNSRKEIAKKKEALHKEIEGDARNLDDSEKIYGGIEAAPGQLLEVVAIKHLGGTCTGTLIGKRVVLTAAHCVCDESGATKFKNARVITGNRVEEFSEDTNYKAVAGFVYYKPFCQTFKRSGFTRAMEGTDLAVLYLDRAVTQTQPVALIDPIRQYLNRRPRQMKIAGFGWTETGAIGVKMQANIDVADAMCSRPQTFGCSRGEEVVLQDKQGRKIDTCQGDSGGPAFYIDKNLRYLAGVTSRAVGGGGCGDGGIYTLLSPGVITWLLRHLNSIN